MKNEDIIEELVSALRSVRHVPPSQLAKHQVRAVLSRLAEIGMSEEMKQAVRDHSSVSTDRAAVAFRAAISSLAGGE